MIHNNTTAVTGTNTGTVLLRTVRSIVSNNFFETNNGTNVHIDDSVDLVFQGNSLNRLSGLASDSNNIKISDCKRVSISGNSIVTLTEAWTDTLDEIQINSSAVEFGGISIVGNTIWTKQVQVYFEDSALQTVISNNIMYGMRNEANAAHAAIFVKQDQVPLYGSICGNIIHGYDKHTSDNPAIDLGLAQNFVISCNQIKEYYTGLKTLSSGGASPHANHFFGNNLKNSSDTIADGVSVATEVTGLNEPA